MAQSNHIEHSSIAINIALLSIALSVCFVCSSQLRIADDCSASITLAKYDKRENFLRFDTECYRCPEDSARIYELRQDIEQSQLLSLLNYRLADTVYVMYRRSVINWPLNEYIIVSGGDSIFTIQPMECKKVYRFHEYAAENSFWYNEKEEASRTSLLKWDVEPIMRLFNGPKCDDYFVYTDYYRLIFSDNKLKSIDTIGFWDPCW